MTNAEHFVEQHNLINKHKLTNLIHTRSLINMKQEELLETPDTTQSTTPLNEITVRIKSQYGNTVIYPKDHKAHIFADMLGQKTLTSTNIKFIKALGYTVNKTYEEVEI